MVVLMSLRRILLNIINLNMKTSDFNYSLPEEYIAQDPVFPRDHSKMMVLDRTKKTLSHKYFYDILEMFSENDVLVLNNTKVFQARLEGYIGEKKCEVLLLREIGKGKFRTMVRPGKKFKIGEKIIFDSELFAEVLEIEKSGSRILQFSMYGSDFQEKIHKIGETPLPPYIKYSTSTKADYQTVYAEHLGSSAAPTAGLHFTKEIITQLKEKGVQIEYVTLHVGRGTFLGVKSDNIKDHVMHSEVIEISEEICDRLNKAKQENKRIIAVGTTSVRVLESAYDVEEKLLVAFSGETDIFIYPGYVWKCVDALITNFHLPQSTLLMLVSSFAGKELIMKAYQEAKDNNYRFFSFGDAMLIM